MKRLFILIWLIVLSSSGYAFDIDTQNSFGTLYLPSMTTNSVPFVGAGGLLTEDATNFTFTDGTNTLYTANATIGSLAGLLKGTAGAVSAITTSAELATVIGDETGTGALVFGTAPTFTTSLTCTTVYGSAAANGDLTLEGTSSGTKTTSDVIIQPTGGTLIYNGAANGQAINFKVATTTVNSAVGTTLTATNLIPAGSMVIGVTIRVTTAFGVTNGLTSISIGDGSDVDRWGAAVAITLDTTTSIVNFTIASPVYYTAATSVVITGAGDGGNEFDATGVVRITVHYMDLTPATS